MGRLRTTGGSALLAAALLVPAGASAQEAPPPPLALFNVTVLDGAGGPPLPGVNVLVEDGRVRAVFRTGEIMLSADVEAHDLAGRFVIPGLINTHVHFMQLGASGAGPRVFDREAVLAELERSLFSGVTAVREMAGNAVATARLVREARAESRPIPDVHFSVVAAGPSFFAGDPRVAASPAPLGPAGEGGPDSLPPGAVTAGTDLPALVTRAREIGAAGIKIYSDLPAERVEALTAEAHRQGLKAWAHATVFPTRPGAVVGAGVDGISHVCGLPWEVLPEVPGRFSERPRFDPAAVDPEDPRFGALFQEMARRGTVLDATLHLYTRPATQERGCVPELMIPLARAAHRAGVTLSTGTDFFNDPAEPFPSLHLEIEHLVESGVLTAREAVTAATLNGARALGLAETHGTVERGKVADMVILEADPTTDIGALRRVVGVVKGGRLHWREAWEAARPGGRDP